MRFVRRPVLGARIVSQNGGNRHPQYKQENYHILKPHYQTGKSFYISAAKTRSKQREKTPLTSAWR
jgi:hypothetical protein